jgi:CRISPR-associated protein Cpf1
LDNLKTISSIKKNKDFPWEKLQKEIKKIDRKLNIEDYFAIEGFILCLNQKGIDAYNLILGGESLEDGTKIQGLNEFINLYRQQNQLDRKQMPNVKVLFKQILSDRETTLLFQKHSDQTRIFYRLFSNLLMRIFSTGRLAEI